VRFDVAVLHGVLGLGVVAQDAARDAEQAAIVLAHHPLEGEGIACEDAVDQCVVRLDCGFGACDGCHGVLPFCPLEGARRAKVTVRGARPASSGAMHGSVLAA